MSQILHILVVEDNTGMQTIISRIVEPLLASFPGSTITMKQTMRDALLAIAANPPPSACIMDLQLADSSIRETIARLKEIDVRSPVIVVTGMATPEQEEEIAAMGIPIIDKRNGLVASLKLALLGRIMGRKTREAEGIMAGIQRMKQILNELSTHGPTE